MASIRLIAQYPNIGNSGHIFLVPTGQKENSLGIGEKINTEMLSIRHAKSVSSDFNSSEIIDSSLIQGKNFLAVSVPIKQVLNEKSSIRVSHVWIGIEGFNVASNEIISRKLYLELQLLIPKLEAVVLKLGYLDPNVARYIEVDEMVEWSQNPVFLSVNDLCEPTQPISSVEVPVCKKEIVNKSVFYFDPIAKKLVAIAGLFVIVILVASNQFSCGKVEQPPKPKSNNEPNKLNVASDSFIKKLERFCGKTDDGKISQAANFFGISRNDLEKSGLENDWKQPKDNIKNYIHLRATNQIVSIVDKEDGIGIINFISDANMKKMISENRVSDIDLSNAVDVISKANIFIENLLIIKKNKVVLGLIGKGWCMHDKFIIDFVKDSKIPILNNKKGHRSQAFDTYGDIISDSDGLSDDFDVFFINANLVGMNVRYWRWKTYNQLNKKIKDSIMQINLSPMP